MRVVDDRASRIRSIVESLDQLSDEQLFLVDRAVVQFTTRKITYRRHPQSDIVDENFVRLFGDALRMHHTSSNQPLTKDTFEHEFVRIANLSGHVATKSPPGKPGDDVTLNLVPMSLKTQADAAVKADTIHISKFRELGKGQWGDKIEDLHGLRQQFFNHMQHYDRILVLRCLSRKPTRWHYELVEIPKSLLFEAEHGEFRMMFESRQNPKPGYCTVYDKSRRIRFELYFDGGTERKLQIKGLRKDLCIVHAEWEFATA